MCGTFLKLITLVETEFQSIFYICLGPESCYAALWSRMVRNPGMLDANKSVFRVLTPLPSHNCDLQFFFSVQNELWNLYSSNSDFKQTW